MSDIELISFILKGFAAFGLSMMLFALMPKIPARRFLALLISSFIVFTYAKTPQQQSLGNREAAANFAQREQLSALMDEEASDGAQELVRRLDVNLRVMDGLYDPEYTNEVNDLVFTGFKREDDTVLTQLRWGEDTSVGGNKLIIMGAHTLDTNEEKIVLGKVDTQYASNNTRSFEISTTDLPLKYQGALFLFAYDWVDSDNDGIPNAIETYVLRTDPYNADSDNDGMPDAWEREHGTNPAVNDANDDPDGDGISNYDEYRNNTDPVDSDNDKDGVDDNLERSYLDTNADVPWFIIDSSDTISTNVVQSLGLFKRPMPFTTILAGYPTNYVVADLNGVLYFGTEALLDIYLFSSSSPSQLTANANRRYTTLAAYWTNLELNPTKGSAIKFATVEREDMRYFVIEYSRMKASSIYYDDEGEVSFQVSICEQEPNIINVKYQAIDDERNDTGSYLSIALQGARSSPKLIYGYGHPAALAPQSGQAFSFHLGCGGALGMLDSDGDGLLDGEEFLLGTNPREVDTDGDGLGDKWEVDNGLDPRSASGMNGANGDPDNDGLTNLEELNYGTNPQSSDTDGDSLLDGAEVGFTNPLLADTDRDGLPDNIEYYLQTNPCEPDTDGDGMDDGWEYRNNFNPLQDNATDSNPNNDLDADPDGDGVINRYECALGLNPFSCDTDGDGYNDGEIPPNCAAVSFTFGDHSGSHSEKYALEVKELVSAREVSQRFFVINQEYGECETVTLPIKKGCEYEVRLFHAATNGEGDPSPDYDYTLNYSVQGGYEAIVEDRGSLFGVWNTSSYFRAEGKVAKIHVVGNGGIIPDYNRDGKIDDSDRVKMTQGKPLVFWKNDDADTGNTNESDYDRPGSGNNGSDVRVNGRCDLLDFTPVLIDVSKAIPESWSQEKRSRLTWSFANAPVNVVFTKLTKDNLGKFGHDDEPTYGPEFNQNAYNANVLRLTSYTNDAGDAFNELINSNGQVVVLLEGRTINTNAVLKLEGAVNNQKVIEASLPICIDSVESMYRFVNLRGSEISDTPQINISSTTNTNYFNAATCDKDVFFLHGFNVNIDGAKAWGSEIFKRLWQSGSNARFHMVTWTGNYSWAPGDTFNGLHYQHNVWYAQRTSAALKSYVEAAQADATKRIVMGHSLGNMVVCEALREGLVAGQYYMFNAAVASEAIDETFRVENPGDDGFDKYVRPEWRDYPTGTWAANWYKLFNNNSTDSRGKMGWANRFSDALDNASEVFNYYSTGDSIFTEDSSIPSVITDVTHWGIDWFLWIIPYPTVEVTFENHSWQKQEVLKGMATVAGTLSGGWGFNVWPEYDSITREWKNVRYSPRGAANALADLSVKTKPVFNVSDAAEMMNPNATDDDIFLALAKHVPAISSPVGRRAVWNDNGKSINMNLNSENGGIARPRKWGRIHPIFGSAWLHSDMKDMAYFYVYKLYEQIIEKGHLK